MTFGCHCSSNNLNFWPKLIASYLIVSSLTPTAIKGWSLFDDLVGDRENAGRNVEAECLGGLKVDDQLELGRLCDRQVGRSPSHLLPKAQDQRIVAAKPRAGKGPRGSGRVAYNARFRSWQTSRVEPLCRRRRIRRSMVQLDRPRQPGLALPTASKCMQSER